MPIGTPETTESSAPNEFEETGREGVRMVALWVLLTIALFVLARRQRTAA